MKIPYNLLMTNQEPILYLEHARIRMDDGILKAYTDKGLLIISPANHILMILGAGTSITQEAIIFSSQHNMHIAIGRGGCYIHSYWMSGRWAEPHKIVHQAGIHADEKKRFAAAKSVLHYRFKRENANIIHFDRLNHAQSMNQLLAAEGNWAKELYKLERIFHNVDFTRDIHAREGINQKLTLLNNALYSFCTAVILNYGLHPSIGLLHGQTRRGGFAFDLADIFKPELCIQNAFTYRNSSMKECLIAFSQDLKGNNYRILKEMIKVCSWMSGEIDQLC